MTDLLARPPQIAVVAERPAPQDGKDSPDGLLEYRHPDGPPRDRVPQPREKDESARRISDLEKRLERAEKDAAEARCAAQRNEKLVTDLISQLDESTAACKDLMETVREQEDVIDKLS